MNQHSSDPSFWFHSTPRALVLIGFIWNTIKLIKVYRSLHIQTSCVARLLLETVFRENPSHFSYAENFDVI